jgi:hypothetical protein
MLQLPIGKIIVLTGKFKINFLDDASVGKKPRRRFKNETILL